MGYTTTPEYETAQSRISTLLDQIGEQLQAIATNTDREDATCVDEVIAEQDKSNFIFKQNELISAYRDRDVHDCRDTYIAELEAELKKSKAQEDYYRDLWYKETSKTKQLKSALNILTSLLTED